MNKPHTIIWDWNGTLLNDVEISVQSMNRMLRKRDLPELDIETYQEVFTFPVINYYSAIGFDFGKEPWDEAAIEFIRIYLEALPVCGLAPKVMETLEFFRSCTFGQAIISAMEHETLLKSVASLGIMEYLDYIGGIGDHYGAGKIENALQYMELHSLAPEEVTLIGDTLHDAEVASKLGCNCILLASGHQSAGRLRTSGHTVLQGIADIIPYFSS